jgi:hypothetical protein
MRLLALCLLVGGLALAAGSPGATQPVPEDVETLFAVKVLPVLKSRCFGCHGDDPRDLRGGLDLSSRAGMLRGGDSGRPALVAEKPQQSPLLRAVSRQDPDFKMPPRDSDRLSNAQVNALRRWVEGGAPWPSPRRLKQLAAADAWNRKDGVAVATSGGLSPEWTNRKYPPENLWAYQPLRRPAVPRVRGRTAANAIDAFLEVKLAQLGLEPAPPADRGTLLRRATFDLIGLPPTPAEIAAFQNDPDPDDLAFARVLDRLLASPQYGEQWGRHWLDVVRYADSAGYANDFERGNAWRYRDYVVRAFNADKPYDRFVREQLAGDEINADNPEMLIAVGFLRMGPWELTGMEVPRVARQHFLDDLTDTVGQVFLAHPLQCARCHDHKFDPVPTRDYYRLQAVFATTQIAERPAPFLPQENTGGFGEKKILLGRKARYQAIQDALAAKQEAAARKWCAERGLSYVPRGKGLRAGVPESKLHPARIGLDVRDLGMQRIANKALARLSWELDRYEPVAHSVYSGKTPNLKAVLAPLRMPADAHRGELEVTRILSGGDPFAPGDRVTPGVLSAIAGNTQVSSATAGRRLALADWIASPSNPLTARVMVNRLWQWHFGQALAGAPNNFGATGKRPTHPELLDWLASEFIARGWSVKAMHRLLMTSAAYRRASRHPDPRALAARDAAGTSHAVFKPRRLTAEELRDAMLAVSGELNPEVGGVPVRPELNPEVALQTRLVMGTVAPAWQPSPRPQERHRRSLYVLRLRGLRDPFFEVFNQPSPDLSCEGREASVVAPQAFSLFNSATTRDRALAFAARLLREAKTKDQVIERAWLLAFGRPPLDGEKQACLKHWGLMTGRHRQLKFERTRPPREVVCEAVEENSGEKFTFTETLDLAPAFVPDLRMADAGPEVRGLMEVCLVLFNTNEFLYLD